MIQGGLKPQARSRTLGSIIYLLLPILLSACIGTSTGLSRPNGVAVAPDGSLYVMDRGNYRVVHLSSDGEFLGSFGRLGIGPADLYFAWDIALDSAGNIYISNQVYSPEGSHVIHDGVKVFAPDGGFLREIGGEDYPPNASVSRHAPYGLDIDRQDRLYVADFETNTVRVFDSQGRQLARLFGESGSQAGQFNGIMDVVVDDQRGLLYAVDQYNSRIQQFALDLAAGPDQLSAVPQQSLGEYGRQPKQFSYPQSITFDEELERLYVGDMANRRIQVLGNEGQPVAQLTVPGDWQVLGLAVGADHTLYAVDALNNSVWVFEPDGRLRRQIEIKP